jgi:hypothetical protein
MKNSPLRLLPFVSLLLLGACASALRMNVPVMRFESPELEDSKKAPLTLAWGVQSFNEVTLTPNLASIRVHDVPMTAKQEFVASGDKDSDTSLGDIFDFSYFFARLGYSLPIPLEITWRLPDRFGLKYQIFGPRAPDAKTGNVSAAVTASWAKRISSGTTDALPTTQTYGSYDFTRSIIDIALVLGARMNDKWLVYGGPFYVAIPYEVNQSSTSQATARAVGSVKSFGGNVGFQWRSGESFSVKIEAAFNKLQIYRDEKQYLSGGLVLSKSF